MLSIYKVSSFPHSPLLRLHKLSSPVFVTLLDFAVRLTIHMLLLCLFIQGSNWSVEDAEQDGGVASQGFHKDCICCFSSSFINLRNLV